MVFLPIEHTALPAIQPELLRRHFIHFAAWTPENSGPKWNLVWQLFEVIRSEWVPLTITTLATFSGRSLQEHQIADRGIDPRS